MSNSSISQTWDLTMDNIFWRLEKMYSPPAFPAALCAEESLSQDTQDRDLSAVMNEMGPELFNIFESLVKKEDDVNSLMKLIYHSLVGEKEN